MEDEMKAVTDEVLVTTDDGSYGIKGFVTTALQQLVDRGEKIDQVTAIGPGIMMRSVAEATRPLGIKTIVSLNPVMVDGTGMCGGCRVQVGDEMKFACVDGPEFDGHLALCPVAVCIVPRRLRPRIMFAISDLGGNKNGFSNGKTQNARAGSTGPCS